MSDFYELDFHNVDSNIGGDAITLRYQINGRIFIHIIDGGYQNTGDDLVKEINKYYDNPSCIDHVVLTHNDNDHAGGLRTVLETYNVKNLWMLRPWNYADELIDSFSRYKSVENLKKKFKEVYSNIAALEDIASEKNITIKEPWQGARIGSFTVLSPTKKFYFRMLLDSDKTPDVKQNFTSIESFAHTFKEKIKYIFSNWGMEIFPEEGTSCENEMSIVQYAELCGKKILLTGDAGRESLSVVAEYLTNIGGTLPGIDLFHVPHHGSRHNVSSELLNIWLGGKLAQKPIEGKELFSALISASEKDNDHPRKSVIRALIHRGSKVCVTKGKGFCSRKNNPNREGWSTMKGMEYLEDQEE
jgi:beta-lactamase superfamily II metal-dependent hydrolase